MCATDTPLGIALRNIRIHSASFECIKWFSILPEKSILEVKEIKCDDKVIMSIYASVIAASHAAETWY